MKYSTLKSFFQYLFTQVECNGGHYSVDETKKLVLFWNEISDKLAQYLHAFLF